MTKLHFRQMYEFFSRKGGNGINAIKFKINSRPSKENSLIVAKNKDGSFSAILRDEDGKFFNYPLPDEFIINNEFDLEDLVDIVASSTDFTEMTTDDQWDLIHSAFFVS